MITSRAVPQESVLHQNQFLLARFTPETETFLEYGISRVQQIQIQKKIKEWSSKPYCEIVVRCVAVHAINLTRKFRTKIDGGINENDDNDNGIVAT